MNYRKHLLDSPEMYSLFVVILHFTATEKIRQLHLLRHQITFAMSDIDSVGRNWRIALNLLEKNGPITFYAVHEKIAFSKFCSPRTSAKLQPYRLQDRLIPFVRF